MSKNESNPTGGLGVNALERGLRLLMALRKDEGQRLSELARATNLDKATTSRLLRSLTRFSFAFKDDNDRYRLGPATAVLERTGDAAQGIAAVVQPLIERLAKETGETASFFVPHGDMRLCVSVAAGHHAVGHVLKVGDVLPTERGAGGRVLRLYSEGRPETESDVVQTSLGERDPELAAVAAPVFDARGKLLGALSLSGTSTRYAATDYLDKLQARIGEAVNEIEVMFAAHGKSKR
jgi:DNA-binding IclR family transcriptional regulator